MIKIYKTTLQRKTIIAKDTYQFDMKKPHGFDFEAGQYVFLDFDHPTYTDHQPTMRAMSIASSPQEQYLSFIMRASASAFKRNIIAMEVGDEISIKGPLGNTLLPQDAQQPIVFLISGIGITAARSMIFCDIAHNNNRAITVLYSNRTIDAIALKDELDHVPFLSQYKIIHTITREKKEGWDGMYGRIDGDMIQRHVDEMQKNVYYVVGASTFVTAMRDVLQQLHVDLTHVHFDNFG